MKKIVSVLAAIIALMLINDIIELVLAYQKEQKRMRREAIKRLKRNRLRAKARKSAASAKKDS